MKQEEITAQLCPPEDRSTGGYITATDFLLRPSFGLSDLETDPGNVYIKGTDRVPKLYMMIHVMKTGFWIRRIQHREHKTFLREFFSGKAFGGRQRVVVCGCRSSLHRYCLWWGGDTKQWYFFYTHTPLLSLATFQ
jgi:hypothetical protein